MEGKKNRLILKRRISLISMASMIVILMSIIVPWQTLGDNLENDQNTNGPLYGVLTGTVTDAVTNEPIQEAIMTLEYHDEVRVDFTDSNGEYEFKNVPLCFCLKDISAAKIGYTSQKQSVAVSEITYVNFSLEPIDDSNGAESDDPEEPDEPEPDDTEEPDDNERALYGVLIGYVTDLSTIEPISDVLMVLKYHDEVHRVLTDSNGKYEFKKVPICFCLKDISAQKNGYESEMQLVAVSEITYANFTLEPVQIVQDDINDTISDGKSDNINSKVSNENNPMRFVDISLLIIGLACILVVCFLLGFAIYKHK